MKDFFEDLIYPFTDLRFADVMTILIMSIVEIGAIAAVILALYINS